LFYRFYRLSVFPINLPLVRERKEDIPVLVDYFIDHYARKAGKGIPRIEKQTLDLLRSYSWPGNIRELQNVSERAVIVSEAETLLVDESWLSSSSSPTQPSPSVGSLTKRVLAEQRELIETALEKTAARVSGPAGAATLLDLPASTLESKIRRLSINKHRLKKTAAESRSPLP
jgi:formate hydrogenlyase transcriptional activator